MLSEIFYYLVVCVCCFTLQETCSSGLISVGFAWALRVEVSFLRCLGWACMVAVF